MARESRLGIEYLKTFLALLDHAGDAANAATALQVNLPNLNKRILVLRAFKRKDRSQPLRRAWIHRDGHVWRPTAEGEQVEPVVRDLVRRYDELLSFDQSRDESAPDLWIGCGQTMASTLIPRAVAAVLKGTPSSRLRVSTMRGADRIRLVSAGLLDLAVVTYEEEQIDRIARRSGDGTLVKIELPPRRFVLAWSKHIPAAMRERIRRLGVRKTGLTHLVDIPLLLPERDAGIRKQLERMVTKLTGSSRLNVRLEMGGWLALADCCANGLGVALLPEEIVQKQGFDFEYKRLDSEHVKESIVPKIIHRPAVTSAPLFESMRASLIQAASAAAVS